MLGTPPTTHMGELPTPGAKAADSVLGFGRLGQFCGSGPSVASTTGKGTVVTAVIAGVEVGLIVAFILLLSAQASNKICKSIKPIIRPNNFINPSQNTKVLPARCGQYGLPNRKPTAYRPATSAQYEYLRYAPPLVAVACRLHPRLLQSFRLP